MCACVCDVRVCARICVSMCMITPHCLRVSMCMCAPLCLYVCASVLCVRVFVCERVLRRTDSGRTRIRKKGNKWRGGREGEAMLAVPYPFTLCYCSRCSFDFVAVRRAVLAVAVPNRGRTAHTRIESNLGSPSLTGFQFHFQIERMVCW